MHGGHLIAGEVRECECTPIAPPYVANFECIEIGQYVIGQPTCSSEHHGTSLRERRACVRPTVVAVEHSLVVTPSGQLFGASVTSIDLTVPLSREEVDAIRAAWLEHHVLAFPDQAMSDDDLERFTQYFGPFGEDPFIAPIPGREHVIAVKRLAGETAPLFAENWHSDWSFQARPPAGTCLFGITIPTRVVTRSSQTNMPRSTPCPDELQERLEGRMAIHSARGGYAPSGMYGADDKGRSMDIRPSADAQATQLHPIIRPHPETGRLGIFGCIGYIIGFEGMPDDESATLLLDLHRWQTREEFVYRHQWRPNMLVMWDNRSLLHRATGGYDGQDRLLHRTTIGAV